MMLPKLPATLLAALVLAPPAHAQNLVGDDLTLSGEITQNGTGANFFDGSYSSFAGSMCVGNGCLSSGESNGLGNPPLKLKWSEAAIIFEDNSSTGFADRDWRIGVDGSASQEVFAITDEGMDWQTGSPVIPFSIVGGAPANSFWLADDGDIGLGTAVPQANLDIVGDATSTLRLDAPTASTPTAFDLQVVSNDLQFIGSNSGVIPLSIESNAVGRAIDINTTGTIFNVTGANYDYRFRGQNVNALVYIDASKDSVGVRTNTPQSPLHLQSQDTQTDALQGLLVENNSATTGPRGLLQLRNNGQVYFGLEDTSIPAGDNTGRAWNFQNLGGEFRVTTAPGGGTDIEMRLTTAGDMIIEGNYFASSGTQLNVPDYVFAPDYDLRPLSEVAAFIADNSHLPGVPSAADINAQGLNMTDMQMTLLKKVEELTLYTLELEAGRAAALAELAAQNARIARLEALITDR